jgi:hypothetical protein
MTWNRSQFIEQVEAAEVWSVPYAEDVLTRLLTTLLR